MKHKIIYILPLLYKTESDILCWLVTLAVTVKVSAHQTKPLHVIVCGGSYIVCSLVDPVTNQSDNIPDIILPS